MRVLAALRRWCRMLWSDAIQRRAEDEFVPYLAARWAKVSWEVAEAMGRQERVQYDEDRYFVEALAADPRREEPQVVARGPRHASDEEADHRTYGYDRPDEHRGRHRHWYDDEDHLADWH